MNSPPKSTDSDQDIGPDKDGVLAWISWFRYTDNGTIVFVREFVESVAIIATIALVLFAVSGIWPPLVAVESQSMEPHMERGDLIYIMEEHRFASTTATGQTGVVTSQQGKKVGYTKFGEPGDVIIYERFGKSNGTPVIHRAQFWVKADENWYDSANPTYLNGADNCEELQFCPAPHAGFITKGDNNQAYDQVVGISDPVKPTWIHGTAEVNIPWLGHIRLFFSSTASLSDTANQSRLSETIRG